jgi:peptidylprolyl isomerase
MKKVYLKSFIFLLISSSFIACGSSGGSDAANNSSLNDNSTHNDENLTVVIEDNITIKEPINIVPVADAGIDLNVTFPEAIILDGSNSYDTNGSIVKYQWRYQDSVISDEVSVVLDDLEEGSYTYTLSVTDDKNATSTDDITIMTYSDTVVTLQTNQGDIDLKMFSDIAPKAVENFVTHSENGYYDGLLFHRVIKDFMIQGGDPLGTGMGGESIWGEDFENEIDVNINFDRPFLLAMGNKQTTTSNGSQFFITTSKAEYLNGDYSIFGEVIDGNETVTKIENTPTGSRDKPSDDQIITKAFVKFKID